MFSLLQFLVKSRFKNNPIKKPPSIRGYTMIELLVGMIMAFLIITPLMGFVLNLLDDDRKEGVRATTDQELQSAMDYIQEDLRQAFYVYDRTGVQAINNPNGIEQDKDKRTPILVFWKRTIEKKSRPVVTIKNGSCSPTGALDDSFVYSLVAYYVSTDNPNGIWSDKAVRIERLEISDGVQDPCDSSKYVSGFLPSDGFQKFTQGKETEWKNSGALNAGDRQVLIDYIHSESQGKDNVLIDEAIDKKEKSDVDCQNILGSEAQLITKYLVEHPPEPPPKPAPPAAANKVDKTDPGFYVCVNTEKKIVQVNLRGNALARMGEPDPRYSDSKKQFFPRSSTAIQLGSSLEKVKVKE
ncbi:hormogonium polysaccharide secretion pseudopilin HpsC [Planktothrix agardhii 1801]|uniref:hormogonium polysaccharide secretion pseudopilin HpsC n=1 Tax=Planktothrix agardhii TaxID=1160 RepID=UPI001F452F65|nr:hormogonium polysaccharide secretion pseudopilin HpsC [Planktothrix agardhii]MCF3623325.1 hormogonium polysaccharide secretion pseudopilin HpsC [Planktothrix agardhii 1801]